MADLTFALQLASGSDVPFQPPTNPGLPSPLGTNLNITATPSNDLLQPSDGATKQTVQWKWTTHSTGSGDWRGKTYPVAMVFGIRLVQVSKQVVKNAPAKPKVSPTSLFTLPKGEGQLIPSTISWADDSKEGWAASKEIIKESSFTYLIPPKTASWSVQVTPANWTNIKATGLAVSYSAKPRQALVLKYRIYCYTTTFGLWFVDPEFDLCPK